MNLRLLIPLLAGLVSVPSALPAMAQAQRLYEVITETGVPHLEESLRYATRIERTCMDPSDLPTAFWMLRDVSLQDCKLVQLSDAAKESLYQLECDGGHGTTGSARWQLGSTTISGTLQVRLGGKNMTFYQRITARPLGQCS
jgi:hypothetical protein